MAGADADQLDALALLFDGRAGELDHLAEGLSRRLHAAPWGGGDADRFRTEWNTVHVRQLQRVSARLHEAGGLLAENARQQRLASAAGTGAVGGKAGHGKKKPPLTPIEQRFADTREQMERDRDAAKDELEELRAKRKKAGGLGNWIADHNAFDESESEKLDRQIRDAENRVRRLDALLEPRPDGSLRTFLKVDASGDGRIIEVRGNLATADHVAIEVPGMSTTIDKYLGRNGQGDSYDLYRAMGGDQAGNVAVVSFFDYDAPDGYGQNGWSPEQMARASAEVAGEGLAREGSRNLNGLVSDLNGMGVSSDKITVVAHSYGTVVTGLALKGGMDVRDVVVVGSPGLGLGVNSVRDLHTDANIHVGWGLTDPVPLASDVSGALLPMPAHGANPAGPGFGADVFYAGTGGHSSYFRDKPLLAIADIALGKGNR